MDSRPNESWNFKPVWLWVGLLGLAVALRAYHLVGFILNYDEAHWLLYSLNKQLLFESLQTSRPRPDLLFALISWIPIKLFGPNELAVRLCPALVGSLSVFPLALFIVRATGQRTAALLGVAFLAVLPLHVYFSTQGLPDTISLFFGLCALACLLRARQTGAVADFIRMALCLALALMTKAIALYCWGFLLVAGWFLFKDRRQRRKFYLALGLSIVPLASVTCFVLLKSSTMAFLREPTVTESFGLSFTRQWLHLQSFAGLFQILLLVAAIGAATVVIRAVRRSPSDRQLLVWLLPLANLVVTPFFRAGRVELLWLIPTLCLFGAVALSSLPRFMAWSLGSLVTAILLAGSLFGVPLPYPGPALTASDYTTAVLARPGGWPSRDAGRWLISHTSADDTILLTAFTFTDPLLLNVSRFRHVVPNGGSNWGLLHDPANRVKYVVFTHDYRAYAPVLARYGDTHFALPADAQFPSYAIYDCQKEGKFVAYTDAYSSSPNLRQAYQFLQAHQLEEAVEAFKKELEVNPDQPVASVNLALLFYELDREAEGIAQIERNIRLGIEPAISYGLLGQFRERQGDLAAAQAAYEKSLSLDPQNPVARQLLANLKARQRSSSH